MTRLLPTASRLLALALKSNTSLTYLDLSHNSLNCSDGLELAVRVIVLLDLFDFIRLFRFNY